MKHFLLLFLFALLYSCGNNTPKTEIKSGDQVQFAQNFKLLKKENYTELQILNPESKKVERKFALVRKNVNVQIPSDLERLEVPLKKMGAFSASYIGMLDVLHQMKSVAATTGESYIYSKELLQQIKQGKTRCYNAESEVQPEYLLQKNIATLIYSGFGQPFPNEEKLKKIKVTCIPNYDWQEQHPLGKAEWIKFFGALLDREDEANAYFEKTKERYKSLKKRIKKSNVIPSKVLLGGMAGDTWFAPAGQSFVAHILRDARINYIYKSEKGTGSVAFSLEKIAKDQSNCQIWINVEAASKKELLQKNSKFSIFQAFKTGKLYSSQSKGNYFWEKSTVHPEWLLEDFAQIAGHLPKTKLHFYTQLK